jgi:peptidoglycan glycosyltransferase
LWSLPVLWAASGLATLAYFRQAERWNEARSLLAAGEAEDAVRILAELTDSFVHRAGANAGLRIAQAFGAHCGAPSPESAPLDTAVFPLAVMTRRAFELGQYEAALELTELARETGQPTVALVETAARIERGRFRDLESAVQRPLGGRGGDLQRPLGGRGGDVKPEPAVRLAWHVREYLETVTEPRDDLVLRDRTGRRIGYLARDGALELTDGVRPEWIPQSIHDAVAPHEGANSLRLTLDFELSELALEALGSYRGSIVLLDPRSGEILAAVADERSSAEGGTPAFEERREPASIAKLITATAALRAGLDPDAEIAGMTCDGQRRYDGEYLYCPYIAGPLGGFGRALAVSCNVAFADLGVRVGRRRLVEELRLYGFDSDLGPFPGGRILAPRGDDRQLADLAIGLEATDVTPLHAALIAAVMANGGVMPRPTLVHALDGRLGFHPRALPPAPARRVLDPEWLPTILAAMEQVATRGTASRVAPPDFPVAMKTGTASHPRWGFHVNYIGVGPMPEPRLAFAIRITHQRTSRRVRYAATVVTRRLLAELGRVARERGWRDGAGDDRRSLRLAGTEPDYGSKRRPSSGGISGQEPSGRRTRR